MSIVINVTVVTNSCDCDSSDYCDDSDGCHSSYYGNSVVTTIVGSVTLIG